MFYKLKQGLSLVAVWALLAVFAVVGLRAEAQNRNDLRSRLMSLVETSGWRAYTYPGAQGATPVLAIERAEQDAYMDLVESGSISFFYNRKTFHSYIRVGDTLFDMWGVGAGDRIPKVHVRSARAVLKKSKSSRWFEAVMAVDPADVSTLLQFYFYRAAILETERLGSKHPWFKEFVDRGTPPFRVKENCTGFVLSAFNSVFFGVLPSAESLDEVRAMAEKIARSVGAVVKFDDSSSFLAKVQKLPSKYKVPMVAAPPGLMRLTNQSRNGVGFVIHNVAPDENFISKNSMNFEAKYGVEEAVDEGFDTSVRARQPIGSAVACEKPVRRKKVLKN